MSVSVHSSKTTEKKTLELLLVKKVRAPTAEVNSSRLASPGMNFNSPFLMSSTRKVSFTATPAKRHATRVHGLKSQQQRTLPQEKQQKTVKKASRSAHMFTASNNNNHSSTSSSLRNRREPVQKLSHIDCNVDPSTTFGISGAISPNANVPKLSNKGKRVTLNNVLRKSGIVANLLDKVVLIAAAATGEDEHNAKSEQGNCNNSCGDCRAGFSLESECPVNCAACGDDFCGTCVSGRELVGTETSAASIQSVCRCCEAKLTVWKAFFVSGEC